MICRARFQDTAKAVSLSLMVILLIFSSNIRGEEMEGGYSRLETGAFGVWEKGELARAMSIFENALKKYPDKTYDITGHMMTLSLETKDYDKLFSTWKYGMERGCFYHLHVHGPQLKALKKEQPFAAIWKENLRLRERAAKSATPVLDIRLPNDFRKEEKYPVLIVFHGYGRSNEKMMHWFDSPVLKKKYIVAFFQSSNILGNRAFGWRVGEQSRKDIEVCYKQLRRDYPIKTKKVVIAGMSLGATVALDAYLNGAVPAAGFVFNCPVNKNPVEKSAFPAGVSKSFKGTIMTGEKDHGLEGQRKLVALFESLGIDCRFFVNPGIGHRFPDDFAARLDKALLHIFR
ncbi:MAG: esterase family protein [bacterium]|nr:esterase family protein [bacterium]